jgi:transposase
VAVEYLRRRRAAGATVSAIARELGVTRDTLLAWTASPGSGMEQAKFVPVSVVAEKPAPSRIVVYGPGGVRVEGLDMAGVIVLLRGLA